MKFTVVCQDRAIVCSAGAYPLRLARSRSCPATGPESTYRPSASLIVNWPAFGPSITSTRTSGTTSAVGADRLTMPDST